MAKKLLKLMGEVLCELILGIGYMIENSLRPLSKLLVYLLPYVMMFMGAYGYKERQSFVPGGELFIPVVVFLVSYFIGQMANKLGKGDTFPVPQKRFTAEDEDGNPEIEVDRIQELILYIADVEEWLSRKGYMR